MAVALKKLHWKLFIPLITLLWIIIGITIGYFVTHEKQRQRDNLENRLLNVNNTVIEAYERGVDLQSTVEFIRLFTDNTTLTPLRITVYDANGNIIADNPAKTIDIYDEDGKPIPELMNLISVNDPYEIKDLVYDHDLNMIGSRTSTDKQIISLAALPYEGEVLTFLSIDPTIWIVVIILGLLTSLLAYLGVKAVCRNVYMLRDFANDIANDIVPDKTDTSRFSNDELGDVSRNLLRVYQEKMDAINEKVFHEKQITMNIRHELNTPVGIIKGYIDTVLNTQDMPPEITHRFLQRIQENADRLAGLVTDINAVMQLDENQVQLDSSEINMLQLAEKLIEDMRQGHIVNTMKVNIDIPADCHVNAHQSLLTIALMNLVNNALKYSEGDEISLRWIGSKDGKHIFSFADNGVGVPPEHIKRIFDLFYRVDTGRARKNGGTGLGLPLVNRIITAMGGRITAGNRPEGGLEFTFTLPVA